MVATRSSSSVRSGLLGACNAMILNMCSAPCVSILPLMYSGNCPQSAIVSHICGSDQPVAVRLRPLNRMALSIHHCISGGQGEQFRLPLGRLPVDDLGLPRRVRRPRICGSEDLLGFIEDG